MEPKQYIEHDSRVYDDAVIRYELVESIENGCVSYSFVCKGYFDKKTNQKIELSFAPKGDNWLFLFWKKLKGK